MLHKLKKEYAILYLDRLISNEIIPRFVFHIIWNLTQINPTYLGHHATHSSMAF